jgi:hypothetical protein
MLLYGNEDKGVTGGSPRLLANSIQLDSSVPGTHAIRMLLYGNEDQGFTGEHSGSSQFKGNLFGVRPIQQPDGYVAVMPYPACLHRATSSSLPTQLLRLGARHSDTLAVVAGALIAAVLWVLICVLAFQMIGLMC